MIEQEQDFNDLFVSNNPEDLFYRVPRRVLVFIDSCPSKVTHVQISYDEDSERLIFCASEVQKEKDRFTISVQIDKIFKLIQNEGIPLEDIIESLFALTSREDIIIRAINTYVKKNVQIMPYDAENVQMGLGMVGSNKKQMLQHQNSSESQIKDDDKQLFCLINNDGIQIKRPKITLKLAQPEKTNEQLSTQKRKPTAAKQQIEIEEN